MSKNQTDKSVAETEFFNDLSDVGKGFFLALREAFLSFVEPRYLNRQAVIDVDRIAKIFTEQIDPEVLDVSERLSKIESDIKKLKLSASTAGGPGGSVGGITVSSD